MEKYCPKPHPVYFNAFSMWQQLSGSVQYLIIIIIPFLCLLFSSQKEIAVAPFICNFLGYPHNGKLPITTEEGPKSTPPPGVPGSAKSNSNSTAWHNTRRMIYVKSGTTQPVWPLPESFWPENHVVTLVRGGVYTGVFVISEGGR